MNLAWLLIGNNVVGGVVLSLRYFGPYRSRSYYGGSLSQPIMNGNYSSTNAERKHILRQKERYAIYEILKASGDKPLALAAFYVTVNNIIHKQPNENSASPTKTEIVDVCGRSSTTHTTSLFDCHDDGQPLEVRISSQIGYFIPSNVKRSHRGAAGLGAVAATTGQPKQQITSTHNDAMEVMPQ